MPKYTDDKGDEWLVEFGASTGAGMMRPGESPAEPTAVILHFTRLKDGKRRISSGIPIPWDTPETIKRAYDNSRGLTNDPS